MRLPQAPPPLLSTIVLLLASSPLLQAAPDASEIVLEEENSSDLQLQNATFEKRWEATSACQYGACGVDQTICCNTNSGGYCSTDAWSTAYCLTSEWGAATTPAQATATPTGEGHYTYWTVTTYETDTVMTTYTSSSWVAGVTEVVQTCPSDYAGMTTLCGSMCCATSQYCNAETCTSNSALVTVTGAGATAGTRGTSVTGVIITSTISPTVTTGFGTPAPVSSGNATLVAASSSSGLSGGAIAGIVIGVIFGVILLLLICLACCIRAGFDAILALFGLGNRRRRRGGRVVEEEVIERRRRSGTADSRRWYGAGYAGRPAGRTSVTRIEERRRTGGWGGAAGAGLGGLAVALGLKRDRRRRRDDKTESDASYDSYSYDYSDYYTGRKHETIRLVEHREESDD